MIVRHQRASASNKGFRQLARYIRGRSDKPRATWFLAANLPGVTGPRDLELACRLVEAVHAQNTRAGNNRTYHMVVSLHPEDRSLNGNELRRVVEDLVETLGFADHQYIAARHNDRDHEHVHVAIHKIHPETFRIHSPAWDHQKLFTAGRALELELGLTPLQSRVRDREKVPKRAADHEAHHGVDSFARWARKQLGPSLRAGQVRSWDDVHDVCASLGVVLRPHGNGLVFEDLEQGVRAKASFVDREFSKPRLCQRFGAFQPTRGHQLEAARMATWRYSPAPAIVPQDLWNEYEQSLDQARTSASTPGAATETSPLATVNASKRSTDTSEASSPPYPCRDATEDSFQTTRAPASHRIPGPQAEARNPTRRRFRRPAPGDLAPLRRAAAPRTATPVRSDSWIGGGRTRSRSHEGSNAGKESADRLPQGWLWRRRFAERSHRLLGCRSVDWQLEAFLGPALVAEDGRSLSVYHELALADRALSRTELFLRRLC